MLYVRGSGPSDYQPYLERAHDARAEAVLGGLARVATATRGLAGRLFKSGRRVGGPLFSGLGRWRRRRVAIRQLAGMSDRMLKDIGVDRGQIPAIVDGQLAAEDKRVAHRPTVRAEPALPSWSGWHDRRCYGEV